MHRPFSGSGRGVCQPPDADSLDADPPPDADPLDADPLSGGRPPWMQDPPPPEPDRPRRQTPLWTDKHL